MLPTDALLKQTLLQIKLPKSTTTVGNALVTLLLVQGKKAREKLRNISQQKSRAHEAGLRGFSNRMYSVCGQFKSPGVCCYAVKF